MTLYLDVPLFTTKHTSFWGCDTLVLLDIISRYTPTVYTYNLHGGANVLISLNLVNVAPLATTECASVGVLKVLYSWN